MSQTIGSTGTNLCEITSMLSFPECMVSVLFVVFIVCAIGPVSSEIKLID